MQLRSYPFELAFQYPFTTNKGTKTHQPTLVVQLGLGQLRGHGEAPAIHYYNVSVESMTATLEENRREIERYALTDPQRFWHFLHHLMPGQNFLIAALDIAGWDLFAQLRRQPLYQLLRLPWKAPLTDYTLGIDTAENMIAKIQAHPWPIYKIKMRSPDDVDLVRALRATSNARFRVDANEAFSFEDTKRILPDLQALGVDMVEQPLAKTEWDAMKELKAISPLPLFADESCVEESDVAKCADAFDGINIKLTKCGGITPALRMITEGRKLGMKVMLGSMNESTIGSAAMAHLLPLLDEIDADGPLLLKEDVAEGLQYDNGVMRISNAPGLGVRFLGQKFEKKSV
ncbi:MAG: dipeptide epimerase [Chitinophagales bacterium]|nr:dipeptide epimerase [Chitinophagales bacterium]